MKIKQIAFAALSMLIIVLAAACGDKYNIAGLGDDASGVRIRFTNACSNCPAVNIKVGGKIVTGASVAFNAGFPAVGYAAFPAGDVSFEFVRADSGQTVSAGKVTGTDGKYYTVFLNDTVPTPINFAIEDDVYGAKEDTAARIRFIHGLSGKPTKDTLEFVRKIDSKIAFSGITFGQSTPFSLVNQGNTPDTFFIRKSGSTTVYPGIAAIIGTWGKGRTYSIYAKGISGRTGTPIPGLNVYTNR